MRRGGAVEAAREIGDLVAALDARARTQIARAELLHLAAQLLEPSRDAPRNRVGAGADRQRERRDQRQPAEPVLAMRTARYQPASVRQTQRHGGGARVPVQEAARAQLGRQRGQGLADRGEPRAVGAAQLDVGGEIAREPLQRGLELGARSAGPRQQLAEHAGDAIENLTLLCVGVCEPPGERRDHGEERQNREEGGVDLEIEPPHQPPGRSSGLRAKT